MQQSPMPYCMQFRGNLSIIKKNNHRNNNNNINNNNGK